MKNNPLTQDPLTLAMAHPLKSRLERLSARPSGRAGQAVALALVLCGSALAAPYGSTISGGTDEMVTEVYVEFSETRTAELQALLDAVQNGTGTQEAVTQFMANNPAVVEVVTARDGTPRRIQDRDGVAITAADAATLNGLAQRCAMESDGELLYFKAETKVGSVRVTCNSVHWPDTDLSRAATDHRISTLMATESIPIDSRKASARGMMARHLIAKDAAETPDPTPQQSYEMCIDRIDYLNRFYGYEARSTQRAGL